MCKAAWTSLVDDKPYAKRFEQCKCGELNKKIINNITTTSTSIEVKKPEDTTTNTIIDDTNDTTNHDYDFDYDLPNNFESKYSLFYSYQRGVLCENDINLPGQTSVRNQRFNKIPNSCLLGCGGACPRTIPLPQLGCFTVPDLCMTNSDCPDIGKNCNNYLIPSFGCKNGKCEYGPVLTREEVTMDDKPYANRFEPCKCERFNSKLTNMITTTTIEVIKPEDTTEIWY